MQPNRRRGRPPEADRAHVGEAALRLFERTGFDAVTMDAVSKAASVSRRTLFRLYPSKADLVWEGLNEVLEDVKRRIAVLGRRKVSLKVLIDEVMTPTLRQLDHPAAAKLARRRLRLIAASPELLNHETLERLQQTLAAALASHTSDMKEPPELVARSLVGVGFASILWWAEAPRKTSALEAFRGALGALSRATL